MCNHHVDSESEGSVTYDSLIEMKFLLKFACWKPYQWIYNESHNEWSRIHSLKSHVPAPGMPLIAGLEKTGNWLLLCAQAQSSQAKRVAALLCVSARRGAACIHCLHPVNVLECVSWPRPVGYTEEGKTTPVLRHLQSSTEENKSKVRKM